MGGAVDLLHKQFVFSGLIARLILYAYQRGYSISLGEAWRSPETAQMYADEGKGVANSLHCNRLAIDLNLFSGCDPLKTVAQYLEIGEFWESLAEPGEEIICVWGGRFENPDADHFSIEHNGVK